MIIQHAYFLYFSLPIIFIIALWHKYYYKNPIYLFSSNLSFQYSKENGASRSSTSWKDNLLFYLRLIILVLLSCAIARFQIPDYNSKLPVEGLDIMLVLDVSGSMQFFDDMHDQRARIDVAKAEALKFISKRENDPIGLVLFGRDAVSRCPLTIDKNILNEIVTDIQLGVVNPDGTVLSKAILTAANRLKNSKSKSKIMIVLTDGEPSPEDIHPKLSIDLAKKLGIKIYTVGVGSKEGGFFNHPFYGLIKMQQGINADLLQAFANETGGKFFEAKSAADMENIYETIDKLERTEYITPIYSRYYEYFILLLWLAVLLFLTEIILASILWLKL